MNYLKNFFEFLKRQFVPDATSKQKRFDVIVGIIMPIVCVLADPIVFKGGNLLMGPPLFGSIRLFGYLEITIGISFLTLALTGRRKSPFLAGLLLASATFSFVLGIFLLPLSIFGILLLGLGLLGLTPFFTGFVFLRNAVLILKRIPTGVSRKRIIGTLAVAWFIMLLIPGYGQYRLHHVVKSQIENVVSGTPEQVNTACRQLKRLQHFADFDDIVWKYAEIKDTNRKQIIAEAYKDITGEDIRERLFKIMD